MPYGNARTFLYFRWQTNTYNASRSRRPVEELIWKHPPEGIFKLNVDEATSLKGLSRGVRIVIRDENGVLMVWSFRCFNNRIAGSKGATSFRICCWVSCHHLQRDAIGTVDLINAASVRFDRDDSILEEIVDLKCQFSVFSCQWQGRDGKIVAQELAKYGLSNRGFNT
ncbi:hypothetical protein C1H46_035961 [Malus baccata]|uniref:Uncharacterized protein n=1 Tax=Malus baccata TaxID=106549 RepID=A0A540KW59_MALBA|nr:hypothetical protein C1H46_035961 [Malus baccata]